MGNPKYLLAISLPIDNDMYWNEELFEYIELDKIKEFIGDSKNIMVDVIDPNYWDWVWREDEGRNYEDFDGKWTVINSKTFSDYWNFSQTFKSVLVSYFK
jgi:hypothetical protein